MAFKHEEEPFRQACNNCRLKRIRCEGQPHGTCDACRAKGQTCIKGQRQKTGRRPGTANPNGGQQQPQPQPQQHQYHQHQYQLHQHQQYQHQQQQRHPAISPAADLQPRFPSFVWTPEFNPASTDNFDELTDAFTVRDSSTEDTEMLDLLLEEEEKDQEQMLIDMWKKRPP